MTFYVQKRIRKGIQDKYLGLYAKTAMVNGPPPTAPLNPPLFLAILAWRREEEQTN